MIKGPLFITFEGGDGCGKSTQSQMLYDYLVDKYDNEVILTREVGGTPEGEKIRELMLNNEFCPTAELLLVLAARLQHLRTVIIPALTSGKTVICDRFIDSTSVYQSFIPSLSKLGVQKMEESIRQISLFDTALGTLLEVNDPFIAPYPCYPAITFFLDLEPTEAVARKHNSGITDKFDNKDLYYHWKIHEKFRFISVKRPRIQSIPCYDFSKEEIHGMVVSSLEENMEYIKDWQQLNSWVSCED